MKRPGSLSVLVQVGALAAAAVIMSQAVAFAVVILAPEPRPAGFGIPAAADALAGKPARTTDGRVLKRRLSDAPVEVGPDDRLDPLAMAITATLAQRLDVSPDAVRVVIDHGPRGQRGGPPEGARRDFVFVRTPPGDKGAPPPGPEPRAMVRAESRVTAQIHLAHPEGGPVSVDTTTRQFTILADRLTFGPFSASVRQPDGRWATVEPPRGLLSPWQQRLLLALVISMVLLAPLVWWMARRLTRPIRAFADAAARLGADPDAEPLAPTGPSEVRTAIAAFNDMQASIRAHMRQRAQTIAAIAHDLRTPLTRLRFRAEQAPDALRDRMAADVEEMDALIGQAMAYVRGETPSERREPFDLATLAADCAADFAETGADIAFDGQAALPVVADPAALRRALGNLIGNAVKYAGSARVTALAPDEQAVILVEDDGPGLPADELDAVFEPFRRGERSRNRETGGAGLGLTVARQAARAAGGDVTLETREGGGLTARLTLPLA